jgi:hypothetical protein
VLVAALQPFLKIQTTDSQKLRLLARISQLSPEQHSRSKHGRIWHQQANTNLTNKDLYDLSIHKNGQV